ncbi:MAG: 2-succinyl-5-enolpyruvyl-6-hydroxy-3-cyclohexene-1-carboxylic-acid synthase [Solirubrobacterales bacterium]
MGIDPTNRNTALASAMAEELARCGVRRAVISPGSRSTPLALALWRQPAIEAEVILDERSAGFFALGGGLATGVPSVVLCTSGSAAANLHPAVAEADEASVPLIVLTADRPPELRGIGAGQTIDQLKLYGDAVRWFSEVGTHEADDAGLLHFRSVACRAFAAASGDPRPGPVHMNVPWREPLAPIAVDGDVTATDPRALEGAGERPLHAVVRSPQRPEPALLDELAERIASTPRGLILAGRQPDSALAAPVMALAAAAGYPVLAEPTSQLRWGPHADPTAGATNPLVTSYDLVARERRTALEPDLVIRFGDLPTSKALRHWLASLDDLRQLIVDPIADWKEPTRRAESIVRADPSDFADGLAERLKVVAGARRAGGGGAGWAAQWTSADRAVTGAVLEELEGAPDLNDATEPGIWFDLSTVLADGDQVLAASSMPVRDMETFLPPGRATVSFLANRGANGIDGLVSTAAGLSNGSGARTWAVLGDLAVAHDIGGLAAVRRAPQLRLLVIDNGGGGIFHFLPQAGVLEADEFEALLGTPSGIDLAAAAALYGLSSTVATNPVDLKRALAGDAQVVIVKTDRARNVEVHRRLAQAAASALARA